MKLKLYGSSEKSFLIQILKVFIWNLKKKKRQQESMRRVVEKQFWVWSEGPAETSHGLVHFHTALLKVDQRHMVSTAACLGKPGSWMDQDHWSKWSKSLFFFGSLFGLFTFSTVNQLDHGTLGVDKPSPVVSGWTRVPLTLRTSPDYRKWTI